VSICRRTARAEDDLLALWLHLAQHNPKAADALLDRCETAFALLADNPALGPARPDLAPDLRYLVVATTLILYRRMTGGVEIVRVVHGARYIPNLI